MILLDDLWEPLDLNNIGIPSFSDASSKCKRKLILTTRLYHICCNMGAGNNAINVECLKREEAWALFRANVGEGVIESDPQIAALAKKAAEECGGLPLALITIGRAMAGNRTIELWENVVDSLKKSRMSNIPGTDAQKNPLPLLKISYDYIKDCKMQECFLHCALWPEDYNIPKDELIECWMGHGFLDEFDDIYLAFFRLKEIIWKGVEPRNVLPKLCKVDISICKSKHVTWLAYLPHLESLCLNDLDNMSSICEGVTEPEEKDNPAFPRLRVLILHGMQKLGTISDAALAFPSLETLLVLGCPQLKKLPSCWPTSCSKLKKIVGHKKWWDIVELDDQTKASLPFQSFWED